MIQIGVGLQHSCALFDSGDLRCWGANAYGALGAGNDETIGDDGATTERDDNVRRLQAFIAGLAIKPEDPVSRFTVSRRGTGEEHRLVLLEARA